MKPYYETELGKLYHGDCLEIMPNLSKVDLVLTDPPYGMNWNGKVSVGPKGHGGRAKTQSYGKKIINDDKPFDPSNILIFPNLILWGFHHYSNKLKPGTILIWIKRNDNAFGSYLSDADTAWMNRGHGVYCFRDTSLYSNKDKCHPTQKPVPLFQWCIKISKIDGIILDPFLGSGTTAVACERLNRRWIGIEIEEKYCEIAAKRIENERKQLKLFKATDQG